MTKAVRFTKAVATGNDFIILDNRDRLPGKSLSELAKKLCDRNRGVGADGMLVAERSRKADLRMRVFNSDGSEAEMCGNGSRCFALYARTKKMAGENMAIETLAGILNASVKDDFVKVKLTEPKDIKWNLCLEIDKCPYKLNFVNTGVPHVVYFVNDLEKIDVKELGSSMRYHPDFSPHGTNANFVKVAGENTIMIRTYERGVEDETLACGTGAVASALISAETGRMSSPITVETRGGERLKVYFKLEGGEFKDVYLEGKARLIFEGVIKL